MKNYIGRREDFKRRLNEHLTNLTGQSRDYYNLLSQDDLAKLKTVLSDINNIFTLRLTLAAVDWLCQAFNIPNTDKNSIIAQIDSVKPNTNGFDIRIDKYKIIGEVKCVFPSNNSDKYLAAQRNGILDDAIKLIAGKKELPDTSKYYKFLFVINVGDRSERAIRTLLKASSGTSKNELLQNRHKIKDSIELIKNKNVQEFSLDKVYLKTLRFS